MTYELLTLAACEQTQGDRAIMALFPGVFTTGTSRCAVPADGRTKGDGENLPVEFTEGGKKCSE
jgi:hypothetical protein